jgi:putative ABC transport system substrate-binding protein
VNPTNQSHAPVVASLRAAAQGVNLEIGTVEAATPQEIESAFSSINQHSTGAVIVPADAFFIQQGPQIADLARKHRMPSVFAFREQVDAGGLMSYGQHLADNFRRAATYVDKIFKGAKPADLPVEQSTTLELVINLKTASALGLTIPPELLVLATEGWSKRRGWAYLASGRLVRVEVSPSGSCAGGLYHNRCFARRNFIACSLRIKL